MTSRSKASGPTIVVGHKVTHYTDSTGANTTTTGSGNKTLLRNYEEMTGEDLPNFRARLASGELLPITPFMHEIQHGEHKGTVANAHYVIGTYWNDYVISNFCSVDEAGVLSGDEVNGILSAVNFGELIQSAAARVYSRGFDALTFLAEEGRTINMFISLFDKLLALYRRGFARALAKSLQGGFSLSKFTRIFSLWLEGRYGWRTLIYDIEDFMSVYEKSDGASMRTRFRDRSGTTVTTSWSTTQVFSPMTSANYHMDSTHNYSASVNVVGRFVADFRPDAYRANPVITAWELVPYSFVIDWFLGVSQALNAASVLVMCTNSVASYGYLTDVSKVTSFTYYPTIVGGTASVSGTVEQDATMKVRVPSEVPLRPFTRINLDQWKVLDSIGLLLQRMNGLKKV